MKERLFLELAFENTPSMFIKITDGVDAHFAFKYYTSGILQFTVKTGRWGDTITNDNDRKLVTHQHPGIVTLAEIKDDFWGGYIVTFIIAESNIKAWNLRRVDEEGDEVTIARQYWSDRCGINY